MRITVFLLLAVFAIYFAVALAGPRSVGAWQDDGIYVATARSLAHGTGYRHVENLGEPWQTKYPILYPVVLATGFLLSSDCPGNMAWLLLPSSLSAAGVVVLAVSYLRRSLQASWPMVTSVAVLTLLCPAVLNLGQFTLSDLPYACLALGALVCLDGKLATAISPRQRVVWLVAGAALIAAAILTHGFGWCLAVAAVGAMLLRKRWADAAVVLLVLALFIAPWLAWQHWAVQANRQPEPSVLIAPDLHYDEWQAGTVGEAVRKAWHNAFQVVFGFTYFVLAYPRPLGIMALQEPSWRTGLLHLVAWSAAAAAVVGFLRSARPRRQTLHGYAALYIAAMLVIPFQPFRYLFGWAPLGLYFLLSGLQAIGASAARRLGSMHQRAGTACAGIAGAALAALFLVEDWRLLRAPPHAATLMRQEVDRSGIETVGRWLRASTSPESVVASAEPAGLFLATGRRGVCLWHDLDPYPLYCSSQRQWWQFYALAAPAETEALQRQVRQGLVPVYRQAGVDYVVVSRFDRLSAVVFKVMEEHPERFQLAYVTPDAAYRIYRARL